MTRPRRATVMVVAAALAGATAAGAATPPPPAAGTVVERVAAQPVGERVLVEGDVRFRDVALQLGTDVAGDARMPGVGVDLTNANLGRPDPFGSLLTFTLTVADHMPTVHTAPTVTRYLWRFAVQNDGVTEHFQVMAVSNGTAGGFALYRCEPFAPTYEVCEVLRILDGTMGNGTVQWRVDMGDIGAGEGSAIATAKPVITAVGVWGLLWFEQVPLDELGPVASYTVPHPSVDVGLAPATDPTPRATRPADLTANGFTADLPAPPDPDAHVAVARACYGAWNCDSGASPPFGS